MNGYLLTVVGIVIVCSLIAAILPEGKTSGLIRGITKLVCTLAIVAPIIDFFTKGEFSWDFFSSKNFTQSGIQTDESFIEYYSEMRILATEEALTLNLKEKFGVDVKLKLSWEIEESEKGGYYKSERIKITKISVKTDANTEVKEEMWEYLTKNYCSEVLLE